ncbi:MAG: sulfatase-like hydrolase/transferase [Nitrospirae bacterium]|nr:sulfatase-like hydrolase/transferase [Nitrospirota bacterium]
MQNHPATPIVESEDKNGSGGCTRKEPGRFLILGVFFSAFLGLSFITRVVLMVKSLRLLDANPLLLLKVYGVGFLFDLVTAGYVALPFVIYLIFLPDRLYRSRLHRIAMFIAVFLTTYVFIFSSVAEYFFFDEFGVRFNFIAVDYLIYTHEVVQNIIESYPVVPLFSAIAVIAALTVFLIRRRLHLASAHESSLGQRLKKGAFFFIIPVVTTVFVSLPLSHISSNTYANELASNGIYSLFSAFRNNKINYNAFYASLEDRDLFRNLRTLLQEENAVFLNDDPLDITRRLRTNGAEKRLNVVVVVEESLSAEYLGVFGNSKGLTPNLDRLAKESVFFTNMHATGTRTDRGLEAVSLSMPPTPGRSMLKRKNNEGLFSWPALMKSLGYDTKFLYGGYGYFDNMNYFFSHNGVDRIIDRADFSKSEIIFENAWGVSDEDLFRKSLAEFRTSYENRRPFFGLIMTTSNHRPYTYPEGRISIRSHTGRDGAVMYADYAIGKFLQDAAKEPWFNDTIFVFVADHCANSAGKSSLPVKRYEIPLFIFSPAHLAPQGIDRLASQIDIAPTVMGLLNISYHSRFFGKDIFRMSPQQERAFIGTYEKLGYLKQDRLVILDVKKESGIYQIDRETKKSRTAAPDQGLLEEAISYYQGANYFFEHRLNRFEAGASQDVR